MIDDPMLLAAPLAAGLLALATHLPLGMQVLRRGIVFIDLAIAQFAALGALVAGHHAGAAAAMATGIGFALAAAALVAWLGTRWPRQREALIGLVYVGGAAASVLWVSFDPHGAQALARTLAGDVLWVDWAGMAPLAVASLPIAALAWRRPGLFDDARIFYPCFAVLVSLSVPLLGLYLVFATLIVPALAMGATGSAAIGLGVGAIGFVGGFAISALTDLPSGPTVVLALVAGALLAHVLRRALHSDGDEHRTHPS